MPPLQIRINNKWCLSSNRWFRIRCRLHNILSNRDLPRDNQRVRKMQPLTLSLCLGHSGYLMPAIQGSAFQISSCQGVQTSHHQLVYHGSKWMRGIVGQSLWEELLFKPLKRVNWSHNLKYHLGILCSLWLKIHNMSISTVRHKENFHLLTMVKRGHSDATVAKHMLILILALRTMG
jgi:hypothetical protein